MFFSALWDSSFPEIYSYMVIDILIVPQKGGSSKQLNRKRLQLSFWTNNLI